MRKSVLTLLLFATVLMPVACEKPAPTAAAQPVTPDMLADAWYVPGNTVSNGRFDWIFTPTGFEMLGQPDALPRDLLAALLGAGGDASRIRGKWRLEGLDLILFEMSADGHPVGGQVALKAVNKGGMVVSVPGSSRLFVFDYRTPPAK